MPTTATVPVMDIATLAEVAREVSRRAAESRQDWRMYPNPIDLADSRLVRAATLDGLALWLEDAIAEADRCQVRYALTPAGLSFIEQSEQLHLSGVAS